MPLNYMLLDDHPLGSGPAGSFWKCQDMNTGELVAIKRIDPGTVMDVEAEIKALKAIKAKPHSHIVQLICATAEEVDGVRCNFIVFKYLSGGSLRDVMNRFGNIHIDFVRSIARQITEGLDHLHNVAGLTHADIKPENILFKDKEQTQIAIADHRLALAANMNEELKKTIIAGGTTEYLAYEVWKRSELGKPMDMWALGVILYVMITAIYPFNFNFAKQVEKRLAESLKYVEAGDLASDKQNPLLAATGEASAEARKNIEETIEKGVDWTLFPVGDDYDNAKTFIGGLLNINDKGRMTAKQALDHQFIKDAFTCARPASIYPSAAGGTSQTSLWQQLASAPEHPPAPPPPLVQLSASTRKVRTSGSQRPRSSSTTSRSRHSSAASALSIRRAKAGKKLMQSEYTSKKFDQISLTSLSSQGDPFGLEDLSFWSRHDKLLAKTPQQIKILLVLSVRAGYAIVDGKVKLVVPGRNLKELETILRHVYKAQRNDHFDRASRRDSLASIAEESESERGYRPASPAYRRSSTEEPIVDRRKQHPRPPSILEVRTPRSSRPPSATNVPPKSPTVVTEASHPPSVHEMRTPRPSSPASVAEVPPASPTTSVAPQEQKQEQEKERAASPAPSRRSVDSRNSRESRRGSGTGSRKPSRQPSPAASKKSTPKKKKAGTGSRTPSRASSVASRHSNHSATKEKSKIEQKEAKKTAADDAAVESAPVDTAPTPVPSPPPAETSAAPEVPKSPKKPSRPASITSHHSRKSDTPSVRSTASHEKSRTPKEQKGHKKDPTEPGPSDETAEKESGAKPVLPLEQSRKKQRGAHRTSGAQSVRSFKSEKGKKSTSEDKKRRNSH